MSKLSVCSLKKQQQVRGNMIANNTRNIQPSIYNQMLGVILMADGVMRGGVNNETGTTVPNVVLPWFLVSVQSGEHIHLNITGGERWDTGKRGKGAMRQRSGSYTWNLGPHIHCSLEQEIPVLPGLGRDHC